MTFSEDQVIALAPDPASVKSGKELASASHWGLKGFSDKALWGECQGSAKLPYQAQVDLHSLAFKCNCPSRKFPCKHGLGLLLLYVRNPASFTAGTEPTWVTDWLDKREEKAEKKAEQKDKPVDVEAQAKRAEARSKKVHEGVDDLEIWLKDLVRNGVLGIPDRAYEFWQNPAKRMIDAQAPGLANMIKGLGNISYYSAEWQYDLLSRLSRIYLSAEAYRNMDGLTEDWQNEIKTQIGFNQSKEDLMAHDGVADNWQMLSRTYTEEEQLTVERNWFYGPSTGKFALILQFIAKASVPELSLMPGTTIDGELVFYKGVQPYRALVKKQNSTGAFIPPAGQSNFNDAFKYISGIIAVNPFVEKFPVWMKNVFLSKVKGLYFLSDADGYAVHAAISEATYLKTMSITAGKPCDMFLLGSETSFEPISAFSDNKYYLL